MKALFKADLEKQNNILRETLNQFNTSKSLNNKLRRDLNYANSFKTIYNKLNERFSLDAEQRSPMRKLKFSNVKVSTKYNEIACSFKPTKVINVDIFLNMTLVLIV